MKTGSIARRLLLPLVAFTCLAQQSSTIQPKRASERQDQVPTFKSATRLVVLDAVVTDKYGKPVRGLTQEDFSIVEDDVPQKITSFEPPDQHQAVAIEHDFKKEAAPLESGPTKIGAESLTIIVFDALDTKILDQAYARFQLKKFLAAHGPRLSHPTALMALEDKRLELLHDYTRDAQVLQKALQSHRTQLPFRLLRSIGESNAYATADLDDTAERLLSAMLALREIATPNAQFAGRKNLIWIGPGFPSLSRMKMWTDIGFRGLKDINASAPAKLTLQSWEQETLELIWKARISIYTIDPRGLEVFPEEPITPPSGDLTFEQVAPLTGGRIIRGVNDIAVQIATSMENGGAYYALAYYPANHDWNGKFRRIRVVMRNPAFTARARQGYYALLDTEPTAQQLDGLLSLAVLNPLSYHSLQMEARAHLSGPKPQTAHLNVNVDASHLHWETLSEGKRRCEISLVAAGFSPDGKVVTHALKEFEIVVDEKKYIDLTQKGMEINLAMALPPTAVRMRLVVRDSTTETWVRRILRPRVNNSTEGRY